MTDAAPRTFEVRHLQLARAAFAALAALMITFSTDHSAPVGLAIFSGFAIATAIIFFAAAWLVYPSGSRGTAVLLGIVTLLAGMATGIPPLRTTTMFFVVVIAWAALSGLIELISGLRRRRTGDPAARDAVLIGAITLALAVALLLVNPAYSLTYFIKEADASFTLTGITIGVGLFGGYAAIVAVFLGIAGFSPRRAERAPAVTTAGADDAPAHPAGETA
ncbi:MAG: acyl-CoA synthetase [Microbacterium sp. SCN 70-200]|uniref:acyl-CoA synthetase n=1 Tax=unclassified Microbacterium TaxID=2609290 RepID=UPI00086DD746|nr:MULTISPECIES: acyl-CoA synthetase [unclassified Microbacterium]MBN9216045.1 acyl-CoA synthetase [Microbacterium sp.]ODT40322.1 MAG: acyl-CoA synthetase [Microbacterium sp. SCN 70-200]OJV82045.1 MAG: acyl-CoA synthetase [Microbacterium sp. 70-16]